MSRIVAILDSFWGLNHGQAPRFFKISPRNLSGRRLYLMTEGHKLIVTDCCKEIQCSANHHGKPDVGWLVSNLSRLDEMGAIDVLLVCGLVAKSTYEQTGIQFKKQLFIDHPAARRWSNEKLLKAAREIDALCRESV